MDKAEIELLKTYGLENGVIISHCFRKDRLAVISFSTAKERVNEFVLQREKSLLEISNYFFRNPPTWIIPTLHRP
jgi:hypothetical protein